LKRGIGKNFFQKVFPHLEKMITETDRFVIKEVRGELVGFEKPAIVLKEDARLYVGALSEDVVHDTKEALKKAGGKDALAGYRRAGIKVNLGGGIATCPATFTDPLVVEGIIDFCQEMGVEPFVCEADMRGFAMDEELIKRRGELWEVLQRKKVRFVNLSENPIKFYCLGVEPHITFPKELLDAETAVISAAVPKDHWECGVSFCQKNMYGAISERRKAIYHRSWSRIDKVVAASCRILNPDLAVLGGRYAGVGWGPHFCAPIPLHRLVIGKDAIRVDALMAEVYGYPYEKVKYAMINTHGVLPNYELMDGSTDFPNEIVSKIRPHAMTPRRRLFWKMLLFPQYFTPHKIQHKIAPKLENLAAWFHHKFVDKLAEE
jgi:uncharacterized protein (DUF362 family)